MRRFITLIAVSSALTLLAGNPAFAAVTHEDLGKTYNLSAPGTGDLGGFCLGPGFGGINDLDSCVESAPQVGDQSVRITVNDSSGQPVAFSAGVDIDGDGQTDRSRLFCGTGLFTDVLFLNEEPIPITVFVWAGGALVDWDNTETIEEAPNSVPFCPNVATGGTVDFTYYDTVDGT